MTTKIIKITVLHGSIIKNLNTGWIGMVINWVLQLGLTGLFVYSKIVAVLTKYTIERVPNEAVDFAFYLFLKGKQIMKLEMNLLKKVGRTN